MTLQTVEALVKHWVTFVEGHVKLILIVGSLLFLSHLVTKGMDAWERHDLRQQSATNAQIATQEGANKALTAQLSALQAQVSSNEAANEQKIAAVIASLKTQKKIDDNLPLPELATRWEKLVPLTPGSITANPSGILDVNSDAAHKTVDALEEIPVLNTELTATKDDLSGCKQVVSKQTEVIAGLNNDITLEKKGRIEDAKVAAIQKKKAFRKGLKVGLIIGFIGGLFAHH